MGKTTFKLHLFLFIIIFQVHTTLATTLPNENILITITEQTGFICDDGIGSITVEASEGVAPYMYSIDGGAMQSTGEFLDITPGIHAITVQDAGDCTVTLDIFIENACLRLIKTGMFNDENEDGIAQQGETITYTFTITNTGNVGLSNIIVKDPLFEVMGDPIDLEPGETDTTTFTTSYVVTDEDIEACLVINQATVLGMDAQGQNITDLSDDNSFEEDDPTIVDLPKTLSTESISLENQITLYPNPTISNVTLEHPRTIILENITIYDVQGKMIRQIRSPTSALTIDYLKSGVYFFTIESTEGIITKRLIVAN